MKLSYCLLPLVLSLAAAASAQTPFTISNFTLTLTQGQTDYTNTIIGAGTATFSPGGPATFLLNGTSFRKRWEAPAGCAGSSGDYFFLPMTFTFSQSGDTANVIFEGLDTLGGTISGTMYIQGGTGAWANSGGTGTMTLTGSSGPNGQTILTSSQGSGTRTSTPTPYPLISPSGIVPVNSNIPLIEPGSWFSIYGVNLAPALTVSGGPFPTSLGGVSVTVDGKPAYLWYVSPGQINAQAPDDTNFNCVNVSVTTPSGQFTSAVTLHPDQPALSLLDSQYVVGVIPTPDGSGAYGSGAGSYDLVGPTGKYSYSTRPVKVGETLVLYGTGFGPTTPPVPAGQAPSGAPPTQAKPLVRIGNSPANVVFSGIVGQGLYQINIVVPQVASGDQPIQINVPGPGFFQYADQTQQNLLVTIK